MPNKFENGYSLENQPNNESENKLEKQSIDKGKDESVESEKTLSESIIEKLAQKNKNIAEDLNNIESWLNEKRIQIQKEEEEDIEQKLKDRENLIPQAKEKSELLAKAQNLLENINELQVLGKLKGPDVTEKINKLKINIADLEKQQLEVDQEIGAIEGNPKILERLINEAKKEDIERTIKNEIQPEWQELESQVDQLAESIKELADKKEYYIGPVEQSDRNLADALSDLKRFIHKDKDLGKLYDNFNDNLNDIRRHIDDPKMVPPEEVEKALYEAAKQHGLVAYCKIRPLDELFEKYKNAYSKSSKIKEEMKPLDDEEAVLTEQYKIIISKAWEVRNKIEELTGQEQKHYGPGSLIDRLNKKIRDFSEDYKRKYYRNEAEMKSKMLDSTLTSIWRKGGGYEAVAVNPKAREAKEERKEVQGEQKKSQEEQKETKEEEEK